MTATTPARSSRRRSSTGSRPARGSSRRRPSARSSASRPPGSDAEALAIANASPYGLAGYVYSEDLERAWSFAEKLEVGAVGVNVNDTTELQAPFGGWKLSGLGQELGPEGLGVYQRTKHLKLRLRDRTA